MNRRLHATPRNLAFIASSAMGGALLGVIAGSAYGVMRVLNDLMEGRRAEVGAADMLASAFQYGWPLMLLGLVVGALVATLPRLPFRTKWPHQ